jgi:hypothetical protein
MAIYGKMIDAARGVLPERPAPPSPLSLGGEAAQFRAPLVVGLVPELAASRLATLPPALAALLTVVTYEPGGGATGGAATALPPGSWRFFDPERPYHERLAALGGPARSGGGLGRFLSAARSPKSELERRDLIAHRDELRRQTIDAFLVASWESANRPPHVLALDADDMTIVAPLIAAGARLAPGGLRWLVDRWDEAGRPRA